MQPEVVKVIGDKLNESGPLRKEMFVRAAATGGLIICAFFAAYYVQTRRYPTDRLHDLMANERAVLSSDEIQAMKWVRTHTDPGGRFLVFSERVDTWYRDLVGEWFPYLAQRHSVYTAQGKEWLPGRAFQRDLAHLPVCPTELLIRRSSAIAQVGKFRLRFFERAIQPRPSALCGPVAATAWILEDLCLQQGRGLASAAQSRE